jgi:hypothetical protein
VWSVRGVSRKGTGVDRTSLRFLGFGLQVIDSLPRQVFLNRRRLPDPLRVQDAVTWCLWVIEYGRHRRTIGSAHRRLSGLGSNGSRAEAGGLHGRSTWPEVRMPGRAAAFSMILWQEGRTSLWWMFESRKEPVSDDTYRSTGRPTYH